MTVEINERRAFRTKFMNFAFDKAAGSQQSLIDPMDFLNSEGIDEDQGRPVVRDAVDYLEGEGLLRAHRAFAGVPSVQLTHAGIVEVEEARTRPDRPTQHFVPMINITTIHGSIVGS